MTRGKAGKSDTYIRVYIIIVDRDSLPDALAADMIRLAERQCRITPTLDSTPHFTIRERRGVHYFHNVTIS